MDSLVVFHRLVQRDMDGILRFYTEEASELVAERFFQSFLRAVEKAATHPGSFHPVSAMHRRANIPGFPYHFLFRGISHGIRILVLRHDRRHPSFGLRRE